MLIYPAIDLVGGRAVRLYKGDYAQMTVYSDDPPSLARAFAEAGATHMHVVDLEGAKCGGTPNFRTICAIKKEGLFCEVGGGIRDMATIERYLAAGIDRVILGTAAVTEEGFVARAVETYGGRVAVGIDSRDGFVAIKGWTERSSYTTLAFCEKMQALGVATIIATDISRDGAMAGTNHDLYAELRAHLNLNIIASGGVSSLDDVRRLAAAGLYGAIIGKAYYTGAVDLREALKEAGV